MKGANQFSELCWDLIEEGLILWRRQQFDKNAQVTLHVCALLVGAMCIHVDPLLLQNFHSLAQSALLTIAVTCLDPWNIQG